MLGVRKHPASGTSGEDDGSHESTGRSQFKPRTTAGDRTRRGLAVAFGDADSADYTDDADQIRVIGQISEIRIRGRVQRFSSLWKLSGQEGSFCA
jgi:hypothetical protein